MTVPAPFRLDLPRKPIPLVFDSPHSGRDYPADFAYSCPFDLLQKAEDNYVDDLFESAPAHGAALLCALFPRTYIDVNRSEDDIDPALLADRWPGPARPTSRSHAGIGLIRRVLRPGIPVYNRMLDVGEIRHRIENFYKPYHEKLESLIGSLHYSFGEIWHVNCHSMPQGPDNARIVSRAQYPARPDFVLGDRDGTSCSGDFTHAMRDFLKGLGYRVAVNNPYRGVELVRRHGDPATGRHSIQLEIGKSLYWDEEKNEKSSGYKDLKADIEKTIAFCASYAAARLTAAAAD